MSEGAAMSVTPRTVSPIALRQDEGESLWFLGILATIKASSETTDGRVAVIDHLAPQGAGSPLHVHHHEDEWFYVTEGELTFWVGGRLFEARPAFLPDPPSTRARALPSDDCERCGVCAHDLAAPATVARSSRSQTRVTASRRRQSSRASSSRSSSRSRRSSSCRTSVPAVSR